MKIQDIQAIQLLLATPKKIAIIPHRGPDGDAMGSTLDYIIFIKKKQSWTVIASNEFPDFLAWLPGSETVKIFEKTKKTALKYWRQPILFSR
jgi:phosphoesterase RecJ-like protein